jgi:hypothetical protein
MLPNSACVKVKAANLPNTTSDSVGLHLFQEPSTLDQLRHREGPFRPPASGLIIDPQVLRGRPCSTNVPGLKRVWGFLVCRLPRWARSNS